jgi:hypothetical protein
VSVVRWAWSRIEPWDPTPAQEEAALRLAKPDGGYVRTYPDGTAELRTHERGGLRRYIIREDGEALLVESAPESRRYAWGYVAGWGGLVWLAGTLVLAFFLRRSPAWVQLSLLIMFFLWFASIPAAWWLESCPDARPVGERWTGLGFPEH